MSEGEVEMSDSGSPAPIRRSGRSQKAEAPKAKAKRKDDDDEDPEDGSESEESPDDASDAEEAVPKKRKARAEKKAPAAAKKQRAEEDDEAEAKRPAARTANARAAPAGRRGRFDGEGIFKVVASGESSIDAAIGDWLGGYTTDKASATCDLLNFLLQAAGYPRNSVDVSVLEDPEGNDISEILEALNLRIERGEIRPEDYSTQDYPLISKKYAAKKAQPGEPNKFGKNLRQWWIKWVDRMRHIILQDRPEDEEESESAPEAYCWDVLKVYMLSLSSSPMRHVRHTATYVALAICSGLCQAGRKAADEETSQQRQIQADTSKTGKRYENMQTRVQELERQRTIIDRECTEIFNAVFAHRYRDVDAIIRSDCIRELGYWVKTYHETFLEPHYLRYCGWMLSDKVARTRLPSLIFLKDVLEDPKAGTVYLAGLRPFLERFRPRLIDMSKRDVDKRNREEAAQVVVQAAILGVLGEEEETEDALLPMIVNDSEVTRKAAARFFVHTWKSASEELLAHAEADSLTKTYAQLKSLAQLMCRALAGADARSGEAAFNAEHATEMGEVGPWYKHEADVSAQTGIDGVHRISLAFEAIADAEDWSEEVLSDWKDLLKYVLQDFSTAQKGGTKKALQKQTSPFALTPEEELTTLCLLSASIDATRNRDDKNDDDAESGRLELSRRLADEMTKLLSKFQADPKCTAVVVSFVRRIDSEIWFGSRILKTHETLVDELLRTFVKHTDPVVLSQTAGALRYLLGNAETEARSTSAPKNRRKSAAANTPGKEVSSAGSVRRKLTETSEELLVSNLDPAVAGLKEAIEGSEWDMATLNDAAEALHAAVRRWDALYSNMNVPELMREADLPDDKDLAGTIVHCLERCLDAGIRLADHEEADATLSSTLQDISMISIEILFRDALFEAMSLRDALGLRKPGDEIDSQSDAGAPSAGNNQAAQGLAQVLQDKLARMFAVTSRLIGERSDGISLSVRATAIKAFACVSTLARSELASHAPGAMYAYRNVPKDVLAEIPILVDKVVATTAQIQPFSQQGDEDEDEGPESAAYPQPQLPALAMKQVRHHMNVLVLAVANLVRDGALPGSAAPALLKWIGVADESERAIHKAIKEAAEGADMSHGPPEVALLPSFWDKAVGSILGNHMIAEGGRNALQLSASANTSKAQAETLGHIRDELRKVLDDMVVGSFKESVGMFTSGQVPSLDHSFILGRFLANDVKTWGNLLQPGKLAVSKREVAIDLLSQTLYNIGAVLVERAAEIVDGSVEVAPWLHGRKNLSTINEGWRACGALANGVLQSMCLVSDKKGAEALKIDDVERKKLQAKIATVAVAPLKALLEEKGLKPQQNTDWEGYHSFVRLLEGKQTDADRKKVAKAGPSVAPSRDGTPAPKAAKGKNRKPLTFKAAADDDDHVFAKPAPKPSKARSKSAAAAKEAIESASEMDEDEEIGSNAERQQEEEEEEEIKPTRRAPRAPRAQFHMMEAESDPEKDDEEDEDLPLPDEVLTRDAGKKRKDIEEDKESERDASPAPKKRIRFGG